MISDGNKNILSDYYGLVSKAGQKEDGSEVDGTKLEHKSKSNRTNRLNLDSKDFDPSAYVSDLLATQQMSDLVKQDNKMTEMKRRLDSDMQMLVYENYNKFISATDMIRQMKDNVESMEEEMNKLEKNVKLISKNSTTIEDNLSGNRARVENLVGVSRLLKRLEFLFELPGRLKKSIQMKAHAQAVKYFRVSNSILQQYKHIKSFEKIRIESEHIIHCLEITLRAVVKNPNSSPAEQMENAAMLLDLNSPPEHLLDDLFTTRRQRLLKEMEAVTQTLQAQIQLYRENEAKKKTKRRSTASEK